MQSEGKPGRLSFRFAPRGLSTTGTASDREIFRRYAVSIYGASARQLAKRARALAPTIRWTERHNQRRFDAIDVATTPPVGLQNASMHGLSLEEIAFELSAADHK